jgi:hypothetical protein
VKLGHWPPMILKPTALRIGASSCGFCSTGLK